MQEVPKTTPLSSITRCACIYIYRRIYKHLLFSWEVRQKGKISEIWGRGVGSPNLAIVLHVSFGKFLPLIQATWLRNLQLSLREAFGHKALTMNVLVWDSCQERTRHCTNTHGFQHYMKHCLTRPDQSDCSS